MELPGDEALGVVEALVAGAEALCEPATCCDCDGAEALLAACMDTLPCGALPCACGPATCCDCDGAEAGFREIGVCGIFFLIMSAHPTQHQTAVGPVRKKLTHSEHPKT